LHRTTTAGSTKDPHTLRKNCRLVDRTNELYSGHAILLDGSA